MAGGEAWVQNPEWARLPQASPSGVRVDPFVQEELQAKSKEVSWQDHP